MPLMERTIMEQKKEFVLLWKSGSYTFSGLCKEFNISRTTGYRYVERFKKYGMDGLEPQSKAPHN
ncbi:MAG: helix-turn-helix domain-containing protein, partial [archaeon]|nr:helix-turn-helix domain-containing protein [archaeon]